MANSKPRKHVRRVSDAVRISRESRDAKMAENVTTLVTQMTSVLTRLSSLEKEVDDVSAMANRWKGVTIALLGIGSLGGWVIATWGKLKGLLA